VRAPSAFERISGRNKPERPSAVAALISVRAFRFLSDLLQLLAALGALRRIRLEPEALGSHFAVVQQISSSYVKLHDGLTWCAYLATASLTAAVGTLLVRSTDVSLCIACILGFDVAHELVQALRKLLMKTWKVGRLECTACLDDELGCSKVFMLCCGHVVCRECSKDLRLDAAAGKPHCPTCRQAIRRVFSLP